MLDLFCQHTNIPFLILDSAGQVIQHNEAFRVHWNVDLDHLYNASGYRLLADANLQQAKIKTQLAQALQGQPVHLEIESYQFPDEYCVASASPQIPHPTDIIIFSLPLQEAAPPLVMLFFDSSNVSSPPTLINRCVAQKNLAHSVLELKHELNNPLLLIIGHTQLLLAKKDKIPHDVANKLVKILNAAEKIRTLTQDHQQLAERLSQPDLPEPVQY